MKLTLRPVILYSQLNIRKHSHSTFQSNFHSFLFYLKRRNIFFETKIFSSHVVYENLGKWRVKFLMEFGYKKGFKLFQNDDEKIKKKKNIIFQKHIIIFRRMRNISVAFSLYISFLTHYFLNNRLSFHILTFSTNIIS